MVIVVDCEIHYITPIGAAALQLETLQMNTLLCHKYTKRIFINYVAITNNIVEISCSNSLQRLYLFFEITV